MTTLKSEVELNNFYIFNSDHGTVEGEEHKKLLYYYPNTDHLDVQMKTLGLSEAMIQFTMSFKPDGPIDAIGTEKRRQIYFQPEDKYWMIMTLNVPTIKKSKDGVDITEYLSDDVQNNVYQNVLKQAYYMYRLFNGTFERTLASSDVYTLKTKLEQFFTAYLTTIRLQHCDLLNVFNGMQFLPLNRQTFLNVQCFINSLECKHPIIKHSAFMYNEHLVWSGIEPADMQVVYQYLITTLLPAHVSSELLCGSMPRNAASPFAASALHHGRFITGPENLKTSKNIGKVPTVIYTQDKKEPDEYFLVVYRALSASLCLFISATEELTLELFQELDEFIGPNLTEVVSEIAEYCTKQTPTQANIASETTPRFIYFNKLNLAYKSTVHLDNKQNGNLSITKDCCKIMADLNEHKDAMGYAGEIIVKTMKDYWVVAKVSNLREFYVGLQQKQANLIDISDEVEKLCENELKGIFFHTV
ncbi:LOW QUALITY PROTEIN: vacuolar fusion protein CCZ1 homolog [Atheta coriaria]|uniref:LOW QUALITY PROTEIN: vacuolar fusion protein CCZ1 homolog n=1 Tax=Dalotia coriaria TaxID=877792 RepID=UPI0031F3EE69